MPRTRAGKIMKRNSGSSAMALIGSPHELSGATHVLLRELTTQKLVTTEVSRLAAAIRAQPLTCGRNISFRDGNGRGQKHGEIVLVGTYDEALIEMNNHTNINNLSESPQQLERRDNSPEQHYNNKRKTISNSSITLNVAEASRTQSSSPRQSFIKQTSAIPLPSYTSSAAITTATVTSGSLSSNCPTTTMNEISIQDNMIDATSSIVIRHSSLLTTELPPSTTTKSINPVNSLTLVPSTTTVRKTSSVEALKEIKHLQSLVKSKDAEITKLTEQNKRLKDEVERISQYSVGLPTDDAVVQWVDFLYESIHKDEIRNQVDLDLVADRFGIDRETLELCLELAGGDRISTARQLFKHCLNYEELIQQEHSWQSIDNGTVLKICQFVREFFGVSLKFTDDYVRESLSNMTRKDSWKFRNPEKSKTKVQQSSSTINETSPIQTVETNGDNDCEIGSDGDNEHF